MASSGSIKMREGDTCMIAIPVKKADGITPADLENTVSRFWVSIGRSDDSEVLLRKSTEPSEGGGIAIDLEDGTLQITIDPADTLDKAVSPLAKLYYEAQVVEQGNRVSTVASGEFYIEPTIIRAPVPGP